MDVLVAGAWPYANGSLHIGHLAALLPGDVLARYHRAKGDRVFYVSGSDCHGTPVTIRARQEHKTPEEVSDFYHREFSEVFTKLGFTYDLYGKTSSEEHKEFIQQFHRQMYQSDLICERSTPQAYCETCSVFLPDRYVTGDCPRCGKSARGDQCDACGTVLEPESLLHPRCAVCGGEPVFRQSKHLYLQLSKLQGALEKYIASHPEWRKNAQAFSLRYLAEGLRDRAVTRDLNWGIEVPKEGYEDKKIYIWAENVLGYLSMSHEVARRRGDNFEELWQGDAKHYYVHGKDNIPFHTIILPALLLAHGDGWRLPDEIISSEYLTLEGRKISTSGNWAIWVKDIADRYDPDSLRYYLIANGPERRDTDFSWREYVNNHNGELLGAYGNFVNRTLTFVEKYLDGEVPRCVPNEKTAGEMERLYGSTGEKIESGCLRDALEGVFAAVRDANKYFDTAQPWKTRQSDPAACRQTIFTCVQIVANLAVLLHPFLPFSSQKVFDWLGLRPEWKPQWVPGGYPLPPVQILFARLDQSVAEKEIARIGK